MKKKIFAVALCIALVTILVVGGTLAYYTDTAEQTNTFTTGKVDIKLDETKVELSKEGNLVSNGERTEEAQSYHLFPAMTVDKDPTITVESGSEDAWIGAIVTIKGDLDALLCPEGYDEIATVCFLGGLLNDSAKCEVVQVADKANDTWTLYFFVKDIRQAGDTMVLFEQLAIPAEWDNAEMALINDMTIDVVAFGTQANGFADCKTAMTTAFKAEFAAVK